MIRWRACRFVPRGSCACVCTRLTSFMMAVLAAATSVLFIRSQSSTANMRSIVVATTYTSST